VVTACVPQRPIHVSAVKRLGSQVVRLEGPEGIAIELAEWK
jgi:hypothetical protein